MQDYLDRLEGMTFERATFTAAAFADWLRLIKPQLGLMALVGRIER